MAVSLVKVWIIPSFGLEMIEYIIFDLLIVTDSPFIDFLWGLMTFPLFALFVAIITIAYREILTRADDEYGTSESLQ
jgi:hypothetical protein